MDEANHLMWKQSNAWDTTSLASLSCQVHRHFFFRCFSCFISFLLIKGSVCQLLFFSSSFLFFKWCFMSLTMQYSIFSFKYTLLYGKLLSSFRKRLIKARGSSKMRKTKISLLLFWNHIPLKVHLCNRIWMNVSLFWEGSYFGNDIFKASHE